MDPTPTACAAEQPGEARGKAREQPRLLTYHTPTSYCLVGNDGVETCTNFYQIPRNFKRGGVASGPLLTGTLKVGAAVTSIGEYPLATPICLNGRPVVILPFCKFLSVVAGTRGTWTTRSWPLRPLCEPHRLVVPRSSWAVGSVAWRMPHSSSPELADV